MLKLSHLILALSVLCFSGACAEQKGRKKDDKKADAKDKKTDKKTDTKTDAKSKEGAEK